MCPSSDDIEHWRINPWLMARCVRLEYIVEVFENCEIRYIDVIYDRISQYEATICIKDADTVYVRVITRIK